MKIEKKIYKFFMNFSADEAPSLSFPSYRLSWEVSVAREPRCFQFL